LILLERRNRLDALRTDIDPIAHGFLLLRSVTT
jgi:hypothetical protein